MIIGLLLKITDPFLQYHFYGEAELSYLQAVKQSEFLDLLLEILWNFVSAFYENNI